MALKCAQVHNNAMYKYNVHLHSKLKYCASVQMHGAQDLHMGN